MRLHIFLVLFLISIANGHKIWFSILFPGPISNFSTNYTEISIDAPFDLWTVGLLHDHYTQSDQSYFQETMSYQTICSASSLIFFATVCANSSDLHTWWHTDHELNAETRVADNCVRRSTFYDVHVATVTAPNIKFDSFVYMSIPRGGRNKNYTDDDGAEFAADQGKLTMSWSSFLYSVDCWVYISCNSRNIGDTITIRPTALKLTFEIVDNATVRILVPYSDSGYRFSVEFNTELYTAYNDLSGTSGRLNDRGIGRAIHTEPRNAMLIFAEPMNPTESVPTESSGSIYFPPPGLVNNLDNVTEEIIYFRAGVYYMPWNYHAKLTANVTWVYLEPGAFVKGAFQFLYDYQEKYKFTGYGILSGEKYMYEADTNNSYHRKNTSNCYGTCVKLLRLMSTSAAQKYLILHGLTFMEPSYHSFVVYGNENSFQMRVDNFKMVGAWYWQTDGLELYTGSSMKNTFFHSNDDVLKVYHSNLSIDNTVIWKNENGPVIQWGWSPRNITNVRVNNTYVIHNKMYWSDVKGNTCVVNSSPSLSPSDQSFGPNASTTVSDLIFENLYVEGTTNCAIRLYALSNTDRVHIKNFFIENWNELDITSQASKFSSLSPNLTIGIDALKLENYRVNGERIVKSCPGAGECNWDAKSLGRLDFDGELYDNWSTA